MRTLANVMFMAFWFLSFSVSAVELGGITMPDKLQVGNQSLDLNGAGIRGKSLFLIYMSPAFI